MAMGRPRKVIDWEQFDKLCHMHCTLIEISEWFNVSEDTIERAVKREFKLTFAEHYKRKSGRGKMSLRRSMWEAVGRGNITMMIWLSKQHLGFADKVEEAQTTNSTVNVVYEAEWGSTAEPGPAREGDT